MESLGLEPPASGLAEVEVVESSGVKPGSIESGRVESGSVDSESAESARVESATVEPCGGVMTESSGVECIDPSGSRYMAPFDVDDEALMMEDELVARLDCKEEEKKESASVCVCGICLSEHVKVKRVAAFTTCSNM